MSESFSYCRIRKSVIVNGEQRMEGSSGSDVSVSSTMAALSLHDFFERMKQPSAADFVKAIKSFVVSFSNNAPDPERDSASVQEFFAKMEVAFKAHPLWAGCSEEELETAAEGLEKYVMTKLFTRVFASLPDDAKLDTDLSEKISLIQQFIKPENLDIKNFQNEASWLLAQKELQKINMYKAPRDKLVCILNCCKIINNLLHASFSSGESLPGADEFLPVLIYVILKANPPQLHSNLLYIQRFRRQSRLVAEPSYYFTNMLSAESFITNINAESLSMDETEYQMNMESAQALLSGLSDDADTQSNLHFRNVANDPGSRPMEAKQQASESERGKGQIICPQLSEVNSGNIEALYSKNESVPKIPSTSDLENKGANMLLKDDQESRVFHEYPYLFAQVGDLTLEDVENLLNNYKQLVFKYACFSKGLGVSTLPPFPSTSKTDHQGPSESIDKPRNTGENMVLRESGVGGRNNNSDEVSVLEVENSEPEVVQDETGARQAEGKDETPLL